ncbi:LysM peptidoglycan-binding domain-containing protein [Actinomycetospora cinnamomea]|uniref:LysM domain-containing protein n=1 Tax=Actinomycetospora cinnamomea TaxID=663609 RepID=A0A2U1FQ98_9PSEU|nr:LysM peptidoglycan-binding domain-containing protein [Actinomycetospora cinnamomea]PVZ14324.1 hypothetical protein C8D89_101188 [Actinomycetospora cinnamomea]
MSVGTTGPQGRCDVEVAGPHGDAVVPPVRPAPARPAGSRPARPDDVRGPVRPAGRRGPAVLPPVRPRVAAGRDPRPAGGPARPAVAPAVLRRRRVLAAAVLGVVLGVLLGVLVALLVPVGAATAPAPAGTTVAVVEAGESLSDVAARVAPGADTGAVVARIRELNTLEHAAVAPGRPLVVPVAAAG